MDVCIRVFMLYLDGIFRFAYVCTCVCVMDTHAMLMRCTLQLRERERARARERERERERRNTNVLLRGREAEFCLSTSPPPSPPHRSSFCFPNVNVLRRTRYSSLTHSRTYVASCGRAHTSVFTSSIANRTKCCFNENPGLEPPPTSEGVTETPALFWHFKYWNCVLLPMGWMTRTLLCAVVVVVVVATSPLFR